MLDSKRTTSKIKTPFVLGAVLELGNCFDLLEQKNLDFLKFAYEEFEKSLIEDGEELPINTSFGKDDFDFKKRELDCAVIRYAHKLAEDEEMKFDSVIN